MEYLVGPDVHVGNLHSSLKQYLSEMHVKMFDDILNYMWLKRNAFISMCWLTSRCISQAGHYK